MELNNDFLYAGTQPHDADKGLFVTFSFEPRINNEATQAEGRNVYKDVEFVSIRTPGDKLTAIHRPVKASDKQRFPLQYAAFRNASGTQIIGTPLSLWPGVKPSQTKELEYFNIRTVEQLATMSDTGGGSMMGIQALKRAAQQYVSAAKDNAPLLAVQKELKARDNEIDALKETLKEQGEMLTKVLSNLGAGPQKAK